MVTGHANVIAHVDTVLAMMANGVLDPTPLVSRHMKLEDAPEAYEAYANREALKIVMSP
jgi:threonine dehydrogenase-like Zn-dependent dehydrogenase